MVLCPMSSSPYATNVTSTTRIAQDGQHSATELLPLQILIPIVVGVSAIMILALGGNVLVIWSYAIDRRLRTVSNLYILNLAVCDLTIAIIIMPWHLYFTALKLVCTSGQGSYKVRLYWTCSHLLGAFCCTLLSYLRDIPSVICARFIYRVTFAVIRLLYISMKSLKPKNIRRFFLKL